LLEAVVRALVQEEQRHQSGKLIRGVPVDQYLDKLFAQAELILHGTAERCYGFIAFYCNGRGTQDAYVSLLVVAPEARGTGLAASLLSTVKSIARARGFARVLLSVHKENAPALSFYARHGFGISEDRFDEVLLECIA
jgi:ribosomal protein S18 acetylase RimI-like enzyme